MRVRSPRQAPSLVASLTKIRRLGARNILAGSRSDWRVKFIGSGITVAGPVEILSGSVFETLSREGEAIRVGEGCRIKRNVWICSYGGEVNLGECVLIGQSNIIQGHASVSIGANSVLSPNVVITSSTLAYWHPNGIRNLEHSLAEVIIGRECWLGSNVVVTAGAHIGDGVVVAANSVVKGVLESRTLYAGAPAKPVRRILLSEANTPLMRWDDMYTEQSSPTPLPDADNSEDPSGL